MAFLAAIVAAGATVLAQGVAKDPGVGQVVTEDPTAISVAPTPTLVPPRPDQVTPFPTSDIPPDSRGPVLPTREELFTRADGTYQSVEKDGCVWREDRRAESSGKNEEAVYLLNSCADDIVIEYQPNTGEIKAWAVD